MTAVMKLQQLVRLAEKGELPPDSISTIISSWEEQEAIPAAEY